MTNDSTKLHLQISLVILASMNELDEAWSEMLAAAIANAKASGREDVADYLALKRSNDALREASVAWLFNSVIEMAAEANRTFASLTIEREDPHEFNARGARMAGSLLRLRLGVRCLTIEAGWTRTPSHGFMRGGALAAARIVHFGLPKANAELALVRDGDAPVWRSEEGQELDSQRLRQHFDIFLGN